MIQAGRAEAAFWAAFVRNRNVDAGTAGDGAVAVAGGFALCVRGTELELVVGAGTARPLRLDDCAVAESFYGVRQLPSRFELDEDMLRRDEQLLRGRGYDDEGTVVAVLETSTAPAGARGHVDIRITTDRRRWAELVARAASGDGAVPPAALRTAHIDAAAAHAMVVASIDGQDAGGGALGIVGDAALLFSAAVLPAFRGNGVYGALIAARLGIAYERGAEGALVKTEPDGTAERAALRHGFARTALRRRVRR